MPNPDHIELNRQFVEINAIDIEMSETEARIEWGLTSISSWSNLLSEHRIVILSSAGTGKTWEILHQCQKLRLDGKPTFFLRLEDLAVEWEIAFEVGGAEGLDQAVKAGKEIWVFLDSIDEARLKGPGDFERALKRLKQHIKNNLQNIHIVLTSRTGAWRPKEDAARLDDLFPYNSSKKLSPDKEEEADMDSEWDDEIVPGFNTPQVEGSNHSSIKYYTFLPLDSDRMLHFAKERGLEDASAFASEIKRMDMQGLAGRPKDLDDLILFWRNHKQLGNRRKIIEENIMRKLVMDNWPEILLEGGDPSGLPLSDRKKLLKQFCKRHAAPESQFSVDFNALQRLITPELGPAIRELYAEYEGNEDIEVLLLQSIELGLLRDLGDIAETATLNPFRNIYPRLAAMRALSAVCDEAKITSVCTVILKDNGLTSRRELANVLDVFGAKYVPVKSLIHLVKAVEPKERHSSGHLNRALADYINTCAINDVEYIVSESALLIQQAPLIKRDFFNISKKNGWMLDFAATACERLIKEKHPAALLYPCLILLSLAAKSHDYGIRKTRINLGELVPQWPELNAALFWYDVTDVSSLLNERVTDWWEVQVVRHLWRFESKDTDQVVGWIKEKEFIDDQLVALTLAFSLYRDAERPQPLRRRLWRVVKGHKELSATLKRLLNPPAMNDADRQRMRAHVNWKRRCKENNRRDTEYHKNWREVIPSFLEHIRGNRIPSKDKLCNAQQYLFERMESLGKDQNQWTRINWQDLKPEFGDDVAEAMRDGLMAIWRRYNPTLASEAGERDNSKLIIEIMALSGLEIEFRETPNWPTNLNDNEAQRAARYLMSELSGFPTWFRAFEAQYPDITLSVLLKEAVWDLFDNPADGSSHYLLDRIFWHAPWFGDRIAPHLVSYLLEKEPRHISVLADALPLVTGCEAIGNDQIAKLCARKIIDVTTPQAHHPLWYAAWVSVDPLPAIDDLTTRLAALEGGEAVETTIAFINALYGSHHKSGLGVRSAHKTPEHLRRLYSLIHQYVRSEDDIDRSNGGVFSPTSRDHAQDARRCIYDNLADIPGKEAFDALVAIAQEAPSAHILNWLYSRAITRAQADADTPWTIDNVNKFAVELERTPSNSYQLFEVARNRLVDLKYNYEEGNTSPSNILVKIDKEVEFRNYLANELTDTAHARYSISQEEEFPNGQRTDIRFVRVGIPDMVPVELKIADKWSGPELFTKLNDQLCGDYMRDVNTPNGIYLLVRRSEKNTWQHPDSKIRLSFEKLIDALQCSAQYIIASNPGISNIEVIGIDLTKRKKSMQN